MRLPALSVLAICCLEACHGNASGDVPVAPGGGTFAANIGGGARHFKSGPIQITASGGFVWTANRDNDSVSRIDTTNDQVKEFRLPGTGVRHDPRGLSVKEDGSEVLVACHDSDRVFVLRGTDGAVLTQIDLPWGCGPHSVAISRDQTRALVTLMRSGAVAVLDLASRKITDILETSSASPLGIAWTTDGAAWITHVFADGEHAHLTRIDFSGPRPVVSTDLLAPPAHPQHGDALQAPNNIPEGGYLTFRGHLAQLPLSSRRDEVWLPTQYNNIDEKFTEDSTVQATVRRLDWKTQQLLGAFDEKVILSAVHIHDSAAGNQYVGPGWDAKVSGPIDIAFSADGTTCFVLCELSNDLVIMPTATPATRPAAAARLPEVPVGSRPTGLVVSPTTGLVYVNNLLSRDVSIVDPSTDRELRRLATNPITGEPFGAAFLQGAKLFHTSDDPRVSVNQKVSCASCHIDGEHDGRGWDLENAPGLHGPRSTVTMRNVGRSFGGPDPRTGWGQLHRSGDRDEVQDFEHTFRDVMMRGTGFLGNQINPPLGSPNSGIDPDLDAIATYVLGLDPIARSPYRNQSGSLTDAAVRGATFFTGSQPQQFPADGNCASCHVPETGYVDFGFHDVGQRRAPEEKELNHSSRGQFQWHVNTKALMGLFASAPYDGVSTPENLGRVASIPGLLIDLGYRSSHGHTSGLTGRQRRDLAEFLLSIDGDLKASEVRGARDNQPPKVIRVEPASLTVVDVWFNETVSRSSAETISNWQIMEDDVTVIPVLSAVRDAKNGDRVTLRANMTPHHRYKVIPGAILDAASSVSGGIDNALDSKDPSNTKSFQISDRLTVTMGASGYENITVRVHDCGMVGPALPTWAHDAPSLTFAGSEAVMGFVRFEWRDAFTKVTGVGQSTEILESEFTLAPKGASSHRIELRRCLQSWSNPPLRWSNTRDNDFNSNPVGAATWRDHAHPNRRWNKPGAQARTPGIDGTRTTDYDGVDDLAYAPAAVIPMASVKERLVVAGPGITDAIRFWFDNPSADYGFALQQAPGATAGTRFLGAEVQNNEFGPVLRITYRVTNTLGSLRAKK